MSSLSTSLKNSFQKWLHPYEEYLRVAKPGVQQQLEFEYGGPLTPSPANSPMKRSHQHTPSSLRDDSPAVRASVALNVTMKEPDEVNRNTPYTEPPRSITSSGFTAVNTGGFTPVNLTPASFQAVNSASTALKREAENGTSTPRQLGESPMNSTKNMPDFPNPIVCASHLTNGHTSNPLKRTISHDSLNGGGSSTESGIIGDGDGQNGRRSKRQKKGTVSSASYVGSRSWCSSSFQATRLTIE